MRATPRHKRRQAWSSGSARLVASVEVEAGLSPSLSGVRAFAIGILGGLEDGLKAAPKPKML